MEFRIGTGELPLDAEIVYPERRFTLDDDNLQEEMLAARRKGKADSRCANKHLFA